MEKPRPLTHSIVLRRVPLRSTICGLVFLCSCGTFCTRSEFFGGPPFQAVFGDCEWIGSVNSGRFVLGAELPGGEVFVGGLISLPLDLIVDAAFLPLDLISWCFGRKKHRLDGPL